LRDAIYIIEHVHPHCDFVLRVIELSRAMGDSYAKEKSSVSSSKKGKSQGF